MPIDFSTDHGKKVQKLLDTEPAIWLTTVSHSGEPQPNPVWFAWEDDSFLIWVSPKSKRVENLKANPKVAIAFSGDHELHEVTVFNGIAEFDDSMPEMIDHPGYTSKYESQWAPIGMTMEEANAEYKTKIRVRPARLRGY